MDVDDTTCWAGGRQIDRWWMARRHLSGEWGGGFASDAAIIADDAAAGADVIVMIVLFLVVPLFCHGCSISDCCSSRLSRKEGSFLSKDEGLNGVCRKRAFQPCLGGWKWPCSIFWLCDVVAL